MRELRDYHRVQCCQNCEFEKYISDDGIWVICTWAMARVEKDAICNRYIPESKPLTIPDIEPAEEWEVD